MTVALEAPATSLRRDPRAASTALLLVTVFFMAIFPTLRWQEFSNASECLNVATALEIRNTGSWLVPTLQGVTRLAKPPIPAWLTAAIIPADTLRSISSTDRDERAHADASLAVEVRSLALLHAAATLLATFALGKLLFDDDVGLTSLIVAGTSLLMLRFCRVASTDIQLTLWVTVTNLLICFGAIRQRWRIGLIGGGIALALAMMCKGPVCLLQTIVPIGCYWLVFPRRATAYAAGLTTLDYVSTPRRFRPRTPLLPLFCGMAAFLVIGLAWYVLILATVPHALHIWHEELTGYADIETRSSSQLAYLILLPVMIPWVIFFIGAVVQAAWRRDPRDRLLLLFIFVPILIMSCFHDRYDRYLLPMIPMCAILTARLLVTHVRAERWDLWNRLLNVLHWIIVGGIAVGLPLAGAYAGKWMKVEDGKPWFTPTTAWQSAAFAGTIVVVAILLQRRTRTMLILATAILMLGLQSLFMSGYVRTTQGRSEFRQFAQSIWANAPDLRLFLIHPKGRRAPVDLSIYLNRAIPNVKAPIEIPPSDRSTGLLMYQTADMPEPTPGPGWTVFVNHGKPDKYRWWLFLQTATTQPSSGKIPIQ